MKSPVTTGMIINLKRFKIMAKNAKELSQVKARQTKLGKKSNDELIKIILKKDKVERNLNKQIVNLKAEVNSLNTRIKGYDADMAGTELAIESCNDRLAALNQKNDALAIEAKDNRALYEEECKKVVALTNAINNWKAIAYTAVAAMIVASITIVMLIQ